MSSATGFIVGFAMFGSITYLPLFMQTVHGMSPTASGLHLIAMMAGLLLTSIVSGQIISRIGKYKIFPIAGTALFTVGLFLLPRGRVELDHSARSRYVRARLWPRHGHASARHRGAKRGGLSDLGAATSGVTFFRSIGSSFGVAVFGAIFANQLAVQLRLDLGSAAATFDNTASSPAALAQLPPALHASFVHAYAAALHPMFLSAAAIGLIAFLLAWGLPSPNI